MSILRRIKEDSLNARKDKDKDAVKSSLLVTLFSEAQMIGKNAGNRESSDDEVVKVIKKFIKNAEDTIAALQGKSDTRLTVAQQEKVILESYLPKQLSNEDLEVEIKTIVASLKEKTPKQMGFVMKTLKDKFGNCFDGNVASKITKELLV